MPLIQIGCMAKKEVENAKIYCLWSSSCVKSTLYQPNELKEACRRNTNAAIATMKKIDKITHDMAERKLADDIIAKEQKLNKMLLDSLPHPAMLIRCKDKVVLAANSVAFAIGVKVGGQCWRDFGKAAFISQKDKELLKKYPDYVPAEYGVRCSFCQGDECFSEVPKQNNPEIQTFDKIWDVYWIKVDEDIYLHYAIDITEHKRAEAALRESEERYRSLFDNMLNGSAYCKMTFKNNIPHDFVYIAVNIAFEKLTGLKNVAGKKVTELIPGIKASNPELFEIYGRVALTGQPVKFETYLPPLGIWFSIAVYSPAKEYFVAIFENITERKRAEESLRDSEEIFNQFMNHSPIYVFFKDENIKAIRLSSNYTELLGRPLCELLGKNPNDLFPPELAKSMTADDKRILKEGKPIEVEEELNGRFYSTIKFPIHREGKPAYLAGFTVDITERKRTEKKLAGYRHQLRAMSSKLSLAEEHQRRQIAAKLHDSIGQDLALSVLKLDAIKKSASSDIAAELDKVKKTIEKTIQDTRTLSFDLSSPTLYRFGFVRAIEQWISEQVQGKHGIKAAFVENGKIGPLDEDVSIVLFQAAREVLVNVIKHARAKSVKVSIRPIDGKIETIIEDDGVGFETSEIGSFVHRSSGFGLFNIRERLNYLGGDIKIESRPGHGTRITLIAPLQIEENRGRQQI